MSRDTCGGLRLRASLGLTPNHAAILLEEPSVATLREAALRASTSRETRR